VCGCQKLNSQKSAETRSHPDGLQTIFAGLV